MSQMTPQKAYDLLCNEYDERFVVNGCRDYGDFYAFFVAPEGTNPREKVFTGSRIMCVDKDSGKVTSREIYDLSGKRYRLMD